ncbi:DNA sulfur modification protein DndB [Sneathiella aquimaris]|uniref:DNA sulfur modification protein DndB n=1 Tax=Sneathiella aquimaris TaxID=2599305 RepID=UPI00146CA061|nr:DNA sulfur modification protein DndB [Sneathiella aquimaris]
MHPAQDGLPQPITSHEALDDLDNLDSSGNINEIPFNVFIGHNLGHRVFTMSIPFRQFFELSDVANDREAGPVAQRPLDANHARNLAKYMLRGLVSAAMLRRSIQGKEGSVAFETILDSLGNQPYFSLQPIVCNIRNVPYGGNGDGGIRGLRLQTDRGETAAFRVFLSERHILWVVDGQHRRAAAEMVMSFLQVVRQTGKYPGKAPVLFPDKGREVTSEEMKVWNETFEAARSYATLTIEVHLGLDIAQERQLFHDLNKLGKKINSSLALQFDSSNPVTQFIKSNIVADGFVQISDSEVRDWAQDTGQLPMKDVVAITSLAFLNKSNASGATPAVVEPRYEIVQRLWSQIAEIQSFGSPRAKEQTVAAQPVILKALAKLTFDLNFSNRRPDNGAVQFDQLLDKIEDVDFSHSNPVWRFYELSDEERDEFGLSGLLQWLPSSEGSANRDIGSFQSGLMRFGAKHNDIFPILGDMIRWQVGLPSRHSHIEVGLDGLL